MCDDVSQRCLGQSRVTLGPHAFRNAPSVVSNADLKGSTTAGRALAPTEAAPGFAPLAANPLRLGAELIGACGGFGCVGSREHAAGAVDRARADLLRVPGPVRSAGTQLGTTSNPRHEGQDGPTKCPEGSPTNQALCVGEGARTAHRDAPEGAVLVLLRGMLGVVYVNLRLFVIGISASAVTGFALWFSYRSK
jgi:hypothetical protein